MAKQSTTDSARFLPVQPRGSSASAVRYLIDHLQQTASITGYMPTKEARAAEILDGDGIVGHSVRLAAPKKGFTDFQRDSIESYAQSITFWASLMVEFEWGEDALTVSFRMQPKAAEEDDSEAVRKRFLDRFKSRAHRTALDLGKAFSDNGFLVREPIRVNLVTMSHRYQGYAIVVRYPSPRVADKVGIKMAYDRWVPLVADVFGRAANLKSETISHGETATIFLTKNQKFIPSHYLRSLHDADSSIRLVVPRRRSDFDAVYFARPTYRACRALTRLCRKNFVIPRRPMLAWGMKGHTVVLNYKRGAAGKIADDSYVSNVRLICEKQMRRFGVRASLFSDRATRSIVVSFYTELDSYVHRHGLPSISELNAEPRVGSVSPG